MCLEGKCMNNLKDIIAQENRVAEMIASVKDSIRMDLTGSKLPQAMPDGSMMVTINLSQLERGILSPEYYIPEVQAKYVDDALKSVSTASSFVKKLSEMVERKGVLIGFNFYPLNSNTIRILKKYLGGES